MFSYVFLLGRPGSGKSVVYRLMADRMLKLSLAEEAMRLDDFPVLKQIVDEDVECRRHVRKEGGFEVTDLSMLDDVLKRMDRQLVELRRPGRVIFVEFSRDSYSHALRNFSREVLERSFLLYIYCPFELCLQRNERRFKGGAEDLDDHIVPRDMMERYYRRDDFEELLLASEEELRRAAPAPLAVIRNDVDDMRALEREVDGAIASLLAASKKLGPPKF
jgi:adenylate kinase family enzyme